MIKAIGGGITSATPLAEKLSIPIQSVSRWAKRLQTSGLLRKDGKDYALTPKAKKLTPKAESSIAYEAAPVKDSQASDQTTIPEVPRGQNGFQLQVSELVGKLATGKSSGSGATEQKRRQRQRDLVYQREDWHFSLTRRRYRKKRAVTRATFTKSSSKSWLITLWMLARVLS
jgi:hypothetical protein